MNLILSVMKKYLHILMLFFVPFMANAIEIKVSGIVALYDGNSPVGAKITMVSEVDEFLTGSATVSEESGSYVVSLDVDDDFYSPTQLYDITISMSGYTNFEISKVISSDFRMEDVVLVPVGTDAYKPYLDIIAKSSTRKNIVAWMRDKNMNIDYYIVKRKNESGYYDSIASVDYSAELSLYIDEESDESKSYFYMIQAVFNDGSKSLESNTQKSFFLDVKAYSIRENNGREIDFDLDVFEGLDYDLIDKVDRVEIQKSIDGVDFLTYLEFKMADVDYDNYWNYLKEDTLFLAGTYTYKAILHYKEECDPSVLKTDSGPFSQSISNLAEAVVEDTTTTVDPNPTSESELDLSSEIISVFPIPTSGAFSISGPKNSVVTVMTVVGEVVGTYSFDEKLTFHAGYFVPGIYLLAVENNGVIKRYRQIIK